MTTQPESKLSNEIKKRLRLEGAWCVKQHGSEYSEVGVPDLIGCYKGHFFAFETKMPSKRTNTSVMQDRQMEKIRAAGGHAQVVCSVQEGLQAMIELDR